jgi:hypothetical protein
VLLDLFGVLLFRPVALERSWLAWGGGPVLKRAEEVYQGEECGFGDLQATGKGAKLGSGPAAESHASDASELLTHLHGPGPHVRGCWALDLILGKE